jgi:hypothetical protein
MKHSIKSLLAAGEHVLLPPNSGHWASRICEQERRTVSDG